MSSVSVPVLGFPQESDPPGEAGGDAFAHPDFYDLNQIQQRLQLTNEQFQEFHRRWDAVVRIETPGGWGTGYLYQTPNGRAIMTNSHVVEDHLVTDIIVHFFAEHGEQPILCQGTQRMAESPPVAHADDRNLDFYFFEFQLPANDSQRNRILDVICDRWEESARVQIAENPGELIGLMPQDFTVNGQTALVMIGHPRGGLKKLSIGHLLNQNQQPFSASSIRQYFMKSRPGNSGSPVFVHVGFKNDRIFAPYPLLLHFRNQLGLLFQEGIADVIRAQFQNP